MPSVLRRHLHRHPVLGLTTGLLKVCTKLSIVEHPVILILVIDSEDGQHFLLDAELKPVHKSLMLTLFGTTAPGKEWFEGRYENRDALVVTVLNVNNKAKLSSAMVKLLPEKTIELTVPVDYLYPYKPLVHEWCVPCKGRWKGQKMKLMSVAVGNRAICESEQGIHEERFEQLCGIEAR